MVAMLTGAVGVAQALTPPLRELPESHFGGPAGGDVNETADNTPGPTTTKALTNAQKLAKALTACKKKSKKQRAACQKQARKKYPKSKQANNRKKG
jgi:hypothetical protein